MEQELLERFAGFVIRAGAAAHENTASLTPEEQSTYARLQREGALLEQEKIPHPYAVETLQATVAAQPGKACAVQPG